MAVPRSLARPGGRRAAAAALFLPTALTLSACTGDRAAAPDDSPTPAETAQAETTSPTATAESSPGEEAPGATVTLQDAERTALDAVGEGRVTWSGPEDDRGAAWEIEVTRDDGSEVDVLVAADGRVVKQVERLVSPRATPEAEILPTPADPSRVTQSEAEEIALAWVGEGRVTWSGPEDDRGAAWEIEVTRDDGSEVDVLVAADGRVVS
ncbi:hypothetical protein E1267_02270 [Nonomuraea longispora]|uniref:PepSY domain-containing protein n=1 Tax=Nonomuraea longispora TaxID=1848320 RepID=A0A4R4NQ86_9ACTN|nr:PepSY domain-containing protein [Nonomuraea longispora]TDC11034.1 hypothetical protein E1267_02270 [Nonomuraea longispora]